MSGRLLLALAATLAWGWAAPLQAQTPDASYAGRAVGEVQVLLDGVPTTDPGLLELLETRPGQPLSPAAVRESITHLYSLGRFQDVQVEAIGRQDDAITLRYNLLPVRSVDRIELRGQLGLSEGRLRDAVTERFGATPQPGRAAEVARLLERLYQDNGYFRPSIRVAASDQQARERTVLTFDIDAGPQAVVGAVDVVAPATMAREDILRRIQVVPGRPYLRERVNERLTDYARRLKGRGYLQAVASHSARVSADGRTADLTVDVQAGPVVRVSFEGDPLPPDRRDELVPFRREGSFDEDLLEDAVGRIREYLHEQGFWKAEVSVRQDRRDDELGVVFSVKKGLLYRVAPAGVQISGNASVPIEEIRPVIVLGPGDVYVSSHLDAIVGALVRLYRTRGFRWVDVKSAESDAGTSGTTGLVRPLVTIAEGPRAVLGPISVTGAEALTEAEVRRLLQLQPGQPYYEPAITAGRDAVQMEYLNLGFASADVTLTPALSGDKTEVALQVGISEGAQTLVDHVIVVGNRRTSEDLVRREVLLRPGSPLGLRDLLESRRRLSALGLFRRIDIRQMEHGPATRRDVLVTVEEAPATTLGYGGGLELTRRLRAGGPQGQAEERIELAPRGFFDIGRRNLGGRNRSVNLFTRVSLRPRDAPDDPDQDGTGFGFSEYRVVGTYREPAAVLWNADFTLTGAVEQGIRSSFNFARKGVTAEAVRRLTRTLRASGRYSFGTTRTFDERLDLEEQSRIDRIFPQVRLSTVSGAVARDTRDDVVEPTQGGFLSGEASMAVRGLGGQVGFVKTYLQGYWFKRVFSSQTVLATRASVGLADGFPREAPAVDETGTPIPGETVIIEDLPASERFFAGGDTTIRGYALDTVGTPKTISERGFPRGGNGVIVLNAELRIPLWQDVGAAVFTDAGNVFERATDVVLSELRSSVGFGVRYRSPIGPIRIDLGFKIDRGELARRPVVHFSIGQAF